MVFYLANGQKPKNKKGLLTVLFVLRCYSNVLFLYALKTTIILADVRKTFGRAPVGAGHAREHLGRGHGPLLQLTLFLMRNRISHSVWLENTGRVAPRCFCAGSINGFIETLYRPLSTLICANALRASACSS